MLEKANQERMKAKLAADAAFNKMKIQINKKKKENYGLQNVSERRRIELQIVMRAKEA